jgi:capsular exopolysaccharide synthesis family protein
MSRFYDALKEANRSQVMPNGKPSEHEPVTLTAEEPAVSEAPAKPETEAVNRLPKFDMPQPSLAAPAAPQAVAVPATAPTAFHRESRTQVTLDPSARLITHAADKVVVEHYRRLRTKILQQHANKPFKTLMVASPNPQEGKTITALNLALSFSMLQDFKVLVVDGDLRRGTIGKLLGVDDVPGLTNMVEGTASLNDVVLQCRDVPLHFLLRGNSTLQAAELLHSTHHLSRVFRDLTAEFDLVIVDSPPVNLLADAHLIADNCDAVLLVARAFSTTRKELEEAVRELQNSRIVGTVLNGGTRAQLYRRYNGYY